MKFKTPVLLYEQRIAAVSDDTPLLQSHF